MVFEHVANSPALEFANSVNDRTRPLVDALEGSEGFFLWSASMGRVFQDRPGPGDLEAGRELRDLIFRVFHAVAAGRTPSPVDLAALVSRQARGLEHSTLTPSPDGFTRSWPGPSTPETLFAELSDDAVELLRSKPLNRIRQCPRCGWLFLDTTRNGTRKWCSMTMCGGQVKAQRHYQHTRNQR